MHSRFPSVISPPSSKTTTTTTDSKTGGGGGGSSRSPSSAALARRSYYRSLSTTTTRMSDLVGSRSRSHLQGEEEGGAGEVQTIPASRVAPTLPPVPPPPLPPPPPSSPLREGGVDGSGASSASASASSSTTLRRRLSQASTAPAPAAGRRNSPLSSEYNLREVLRSKTEQILSPAAAVVSADSSTWHNVPLAFAVLPAVGGVLFKGGDYFVTDVILLFLAAVFLHWLVKFPWEWYNGSQALRYDRDAFETLASPEEYFKDENSPGVKRSAHEERAQEEAANELRMNEILALLACFVGPCVGGWLLHAIRSQLSRPSEGLVSNFNITIFVLAAELRPAAQVVKLLRSRTLHLQSIVHHPPMTRMDALAVKLEELNAEVRELTALATKSVDRESRLDALTRAVRRYEKRETVQSAQTENRILEMDGRLNDVLTLAAAASARQGHTTFSMILFEWMCAAIVIPFSLTWKVVSLPAKAVETLAGFSKNQLLLKGGRRQQSRLKGRPKGIKGKGAI